MTSYYGLDETILMKSIHTHILAHCSENLVALLMFKTSDKPACMVLACKQKTVSVSYAVSEEFVKCVTLLLCTNWSKMKLSRTNSALRSLAMLTGSYLNLYFL